MINPISDIVWDCIFPIEIAGIPLDFGEHPPDNDGTEFFCECEGKGFTGMGFLVSFSGMITFRAADNIRAAAAGLPLEAMLVETDTPYLAPVPHRGKPGEPAFVIETAKKLAEVKGVDLERVAEVTTGNFERLFGR